MNRHIKRLLNDWSRLGTEETDHALFVGQVTGRGPFSYLHTVFKPAPDALIRALPQRLRDHTALTSTLAEMNGCGLFREYVGAIRLFGVRDERELINGTGGLETVRPYSLLNRPDHGDGWCQVGDYGADGSPIILGPKGEVVVLYPESGEARRDWPTLDAWLREETSRLSGLFSRETGTLEAEDFDQTLPG